MAVTIDGRTLKANKVARVSRRSAGGRFEKVKLSDASRASILATRNWLDSNFMNDEAPLMYSFNTGVGLFKDQLATNVETVVLPFLQVLNYFDLVAHDRTTFSRGLSLCPTKSQKMFFLL